jgi:hypothetical protein
MTSRRRSPSLDHLESRNLLSVAVSPPSEVARLPHVVPFAATETLTSRTTIAVSPEINRVTNTSIGNGSPLGRNFTDSLSVNEPTNPSGVFPLTDGTITFETADGSSTLTGTLTGTARLYTDPKTGDEHVVAVAHITITSGTGRFAGATGQITRFVNNDITTTTGYSEDFGFISATRPNT